MPTSSSGTRHFRSNDPSHDAIGAAVLNWWSFWMEYIEENRFSLMENLQNDLITVIKWKLMKSQRHALAHHIAVVTSPPALQSEQPE